MIDSTAPRRSAARGRILHHAAAIASLEGLRGLTVARLATDANTSKSNVVERFGDQEGLYLATVAHAAEVFHHQVIDPASVKPPGHARLEALLEGWMRYVDTQVFPGGCLLTRLAGEHQAIPAVAAEVDALVTAWTGGLEQQARLAGLRQAKVVAFALNAVGASAAIGRPPATGLARRMFRILLADTG